MSTLTMGSMEIFIFARGLDSQSSLECPDSESLSTWSALNTSRAPQFVPHRSNLLLRAMQVTSSDVFRPVTAVFLHENIAKFSIFHTWIDLFQAEAPHQLLELAGGRVAGDDGVDVQVVVLKEDLVAEIVHGPDHPVPSPVPLAPPVGHVDVGVRAVVVLSQSPRRQGGAKYNITEHK